MPQYRCAPCSVQLHSAEDPVGGAGELCPACGSLLEPQRTFPELVEFRADRSALGAPGTGLIRQAQ